MTYKLKFKRCFFIGISVIILSNVLKRNVLWDFFDSYKTIWTKQFYKLNIKKNTYQHAKNLHFPFYNFMTILFLLLSPFCIAKSAFLYTYDASNDPSLYKLLEQG